jgi:hypothetical protein
MTDERTAITDMREQIIALLKNSDLTPGCKCMASLMVAAYACRAAEMEPELAIHMLKSLFRDPLR